MQLQKLLDPEERRAIIPLFLYLSQKRLKDTELRHQMLESSIELTTAKSQARARKQKQLKAAALVHLMVYIKGNKLSRKDMVTKRHGKFWYNNNYIVATCALYHISFATRGGSNLPGTCFLC